MYCTRGVRADGQQGEARREADSFGVAALISKATENDNGKN